MRTFTNGLGDDYTTSYLLDYVYLKNYKIITIDLSKQQVLQADLKAIQQINFIGNLDHNENKTMFYIIEEAKEIILDFSQGTVKI